MARGDQASEYESRVADWLGRGSLLARDNAQLAHCTTCSSFAKIHKTLLVIPAMQAGISDHVWSLEEIAKLAG